MHMYMTSNRTTPHIPEIDPPRELFSAVLTRIAFARQRTARFRLAAFGTVTFVSVLMLIPAVQYALNEFYTSGFYDYASLFFDSLSRGYWQELLYSLTDSLPSLALLLLAIIGTAFVWSARQTNRNARIAFTRLALPA
jgi:hypothetical protein